MPERILVVDDHLEMARLLAEQLADEGYATEVATSGAEALRRVRADPPDLVITDLRMADVDGMDVLEGVRAIDASLPVILMTAFGAIDTAIEAMKRGAWYYLTKPFQLDAALLHVQRALGERRLRAENAALRRMAQERDALGEMVGSSPPMQQLFQTIRRLAQVDAPVLIQGESGCGKELVARALHDSGPRQGRTFVAINCTALPASLLESELFGHTRGAFTGAGAPRKGLFVEADGGTLFLDEIGDMAPELQSRLLRVLQDGEIRPVGSDTARKVDVRVVAATHQPLRERIAEGKFRADLFYRLSVVPLHLPPLRERVADLPLLARRFLDQAAAAYPASALRSLSPEVMAALARHSWPGNVRELENLVHRLAIMCPRAEAGVADLRLLAPDLFAGEPAPAAIPALQQAKESMPTLRQLQEEYIAWVLDQCGGSKPRAAEILGVDLSTLYRRQQGEARRQR